MDPAAAGIPPALDVIAYAAHIACQLGAHIVKVKPPTALVEQKDKDTKKMVKKEPLKTPKEKKEAKKLKKLERQRG